MDKIFTSHDKSKILAVIAQVQKQAMCLKCEGDKYPWKQVYGIYPLFLKPKDLAFALGISEKTLESWRAKKIGPPFIRMANNLVRYPFVDLEKWIDERLISESQAD